MAVVEVQAKGFGVELIDEVLPGVHVLRHPGSVHSRRVEAVEMDRMRVCSGIGKADANTVPLARTNGGAGHPPVVGPGRKVNARGNLDLAVRRYKFVLAQRLAVGQCGNCAAVKVGKVATRVQAAGSDVRQRWSESSVAE